ncbi:MAG: hypothetical protein WC500_04850 [Candidatus Margulisiibacteriota bacterium]
MAKLLKQILIVLMLAALLPLAAFAAQQPAPYPVGFWVNGALQKDASSLPPTLDGFKAYFYKTSSGGYVPGTAYAVASSDANGNFSINALEDLGLLPLSATNYYFGVAKKEFTVGGVKRSWGINEKDLTLTAADINNGYVNLTALFTTLVEGQGLNPTGETSGLTILRAGDTPGSNITVTWDPAKFGGTNPKIYVMTGNGTGQYKKDFISNVWYEVFDGNALVGGYPSYFGTFAVDPVTYKLTHNGQVGKIDSSSSPEVYYKGYGGTVTGGVPDDLTTFASAPAVGKLIVYAYGDSKVNAIGVPFISNANTIDDVLSTSLQQKDIEYLKFNSSAQQYAGGYYDSGWKGTAITLAQGDGIWIYNPISGNNIPLTIVGNVPAPNIDIARTIYGPQKNNKIALPHPQGGSLTANGLDPLAGAEILIFDNYLQTYTGTYVEGGNWKNNLFVTPGKGFWYYNLGSDFTWKAMVK